MSGNPCFAPSLAQLLGIRAAVSISITNPPPGFMDALGTLPESVAVIGSGVLGIDVQVHFTCKKVEAVERLSIMVRRMAPRGSIWLCIPIGVANGQVPSEEFIRLAAIELGLRDIRVLQLSLDWCGLLLKRKLSPARVELPPTSPG